MNWYLKVLKQYADFKGRARRKEYWMFVLFLYIFYAVCAGLDFLLGTYTIISLLYMLAFLIPNLAVVVRRLHDVGKGGGWIFISCVPLIGAIWLLILLCSDSEQGNNRFGENPKE
jgi:uncharacterized membrane protein YhaH (DUF805 family)